MGGRPSKGAALIIALLVTALAAASAVVLLERTDRWLERLASQRDKQQAYLLARAGLSYATAILEADRQTGEIDSLQEDWARRLPAVRLEDAEIAGHIEDVQGRFNLNNLRRADGSIDADALLAYRRLLALLGLDERLAGTLAGRLQGLARPPLQHWSELAALPGYDAPACRRLADFVVALPEAQPLNVNTASAELLSAVQPGLGLAMARTLAEARQRVPFRDAGDFRNRLPDSGFPPALLPLLVASRHFLIQVEVRHGRAVSRLAALIRRADRRLPQKTYWLNLQ